MKLTVLASGRGSNFAAIADAVLDRTIRDTEIVALVCNKPDAPALELAKSRSIPTHVINSKSFRKDGIFDRSEYEKQLPVVFTPINITVAKVGNNFILDPNYAEAHTNLGTIYFRQGLFDQALVEHQRAVEIKPEYAKGYYNIGSVYRENRKIEEAIASFKKALEINPKYAEAHYALAIIYYEKKEFKSAVEEADQAGKLGIVVDPKFLEQLKPYR
jgi:tetratricopeptide (TPR) repeat protein